MCSAQHAQLDRAPLTRTSIRDLLILGANQATSPSEQVIPRLTTTAPSPPKTTTDFWKRCDVVPGGWWHDGHPSDLNGSYLGGPTRALQTTSAGGGGSVQQPHHGVGVEGAGHRGQCPPAGAPGSGSLHTHGWGRLIHSPLLEGEAGLRHCPHGSGRAWAGASRSVAPVTSRPLPPRG